MEKINFVNDTTPALNATNLNKLQQNVEDVTGDLSDLETSDRDNLVEAINEAKRSGGDAVPIHSIFDYDGDTVPTGYEEVEETEDYSTSETNTGKKWIDGKPIYRKTINSGEISLSTTNTEISTGISNVDTVININFMYKFSTNMWYKLWNIKEIGYNKTNNKLLVSTTSSANFTDSNIVIEYTKTID